MQTNYSKLWKQMTAQFVLGERSMHGPTHWKSVEANGLQLCRLNGADETVVRLFAVFHDVERQNDGYDPEHGRRAAKLIQRIHGVDFKISDSRMESLLEACSFHNDGLTSSNVTIGTCWDADRMDLPRVGMKIDHRMMSTSHGIDYAIRGDVALQGIAAEDV